MVERRSSPILDEVSQPLIPEAMTSMLDNVPVPSVRTWRSEAMSEDLHVFFVLRDFLVLLLMDLLF